MKAPLRLPNTAPRQSVLIDVFNRAAGGAPGVPEEFVVSLADLFPAGLTSELLGTDDTYRGPDIRRYNAGTTLTQWQAVYLSSSGTWLLADANGSGTFPMRGLVSADTASGALAVVVTEGEVRNDAWNWTVGGNLYLSETPGAITQTAPTASGSNVQAIGYATSADTILLNVTPGFRPIP